MIYGDIRRDYRERMRQRAVPPVESENLTDGHRPILALDRKYIPLID